MIVRKWLAERAPELAGNVLRHLGRGAPGVLGPILVAVGLSLAWLPLGVVAAGAILWLVDWRIPDEPTQDDVPLQVLRREESRRQVKRTQRRWGA